MIKKNLNLTTEFKQQDMLLKRKLKQFNLNQFFILKLILMVQEHKMQLMVTMNLIWLLKIAIQCCNLEILNSRLCLLFPIQRNI